MNLKTIQKETERHAKAMNELVGQLKTYILSLPDNPKIKKLSNNCFSISSKDLGNNWSAGYHDFKRQYNLIVAKLEAGEPVNVFKKLHKIIEESKIIYHSSESCPKHIVNLHPDVVSHLRKLADMPPTNCPICNGQREWTGKGIKANCFFCNKKYNYQSI